MKTKRPDRFFFILTFVLALVGFLVFSSAALGLLGRDGASFTMIAGKQLFILLFSLALCVIVSGIPYHYWQKAAPYLLAIAIGLTLLVFVPGIGSEAGGAHRWIKVPGGFSFQPGELLKLTAIMAWAWWLAGVKDKVKTFTYGLLPLLVLCGALGAILLAQPNTSTLGIIVITATAMFFIAGGRLTHFLLMGLLGVIVLATVAFTRPYVMSRIVTLINPAHDVQGQSYQLNQASIAIGSGGIFGRGFGQSVQKFNNLPEPIGDSVFAVAAEEFGLVGVTVFLLLLLVFALWGLKISGRVQDPFGKLLSFGIIMLIVCQSFINIGAMIGLFPLTGVPLVFVSQGGSALLLALIEAGIVLSISRHRQTA